MNIIFNSPPMTFNHWCSTDRPTPNCLDCAYIKKHNVLILYTVYKDDHFITYTNDDDITDYGLFCLVLFFISDNLYVSILNNHPSITKEHIEDIFFYEDIITSIFDSVTLWHQSYM